MESQNNNPSNTPTTRLFIGGLPYKFTEGELLDLFVPFGRVVSLKIMHTKWGKSRGIGFIEFDTLESSVAAKQQLHNHRVDVDRTIIVDYAQPDPFNTPEGQERHRVAVETKEKRFARFKKNLPSAHHQDGDAPAFVPHPVRKPEYGTMRQSVYDSRTHHSRTGAKFAKRTRKSK